MAAGQSVLGDIGVSETTVAGAVTDTGPLVSSVFDNDACLAQQGGTWMTPEAVIEAGDGGPAMLFWQVSGFTQSAPGPIKAQPVIAGASDGSVGAACFTNLDAVHTALVRRRALLQQPLSPGESFVQVAAAIGLASDGNDAVTMALLNLGAMSVPPQVRLSSWGTASGSNGEYCDQPFASNGGPLFIAVAATAWSKTADQQIGAMLYLDGDPIAYPKLFANQAGAHLGLVGTDKVYTASPGGHTLTLMADGQTVCDSNDVWSVMVLEMAGSSTAWQAFDNTPCPSQSGGQVLAGCPYTARGGVQLICVSLSGYSAAPNTMLQAQVLIDGDQVGTLQIFANQAEQHLLLCGGDIAPGSLPAGTHQVQVVAGDGMVTDSNDTISLTVIEVFP